MACRKRVPATEAEITMAWAAQRRVTAITEKYKYADAQLAADVVFGLVPESVLGQLSGR